MALLQNNVGNFVEPITTNVKMPDGKSFNLGFEAFDPLSPLTIPSYIQAARNTSVYAPKDNTATRILQQGKNSKAVATYSGGKMVSDPTQIKPENLVVMPIQCYPCQIAAKFRMVQMDLQAPNLKNILANQLDDWMRQQVLKFENTILNMLIQSSQNVQTNLIQKTDAGATTLGKGAHYESRDITNFDDAINSFWEASNNFKKIGLLNAKTKYDQGNYFVTGVPGEDILCICSWDFFRKLTSSEKLLASSEGLSQIFINMGLRRVYDVPILPLNTMPDGAHFVFITTGKYGAFCYNAAVQGLTTRINPEPDWTENLIAQLSYTYLLAIVNESLIISCVDKTFKTGELLMPVSMVTERAPQSAIESK